jgi:hypothetical protein
MKWASKDANCKFDKPCWGHRHGGWQGGVSRVTTPGQFLFDVQGQGGKLGSELGTVGVRYKTLVVLF